MKIQLPIHRRRLALPLVAAAACVSLTMSALPAWADTNKATLKQQYSCHVAAGVYGLPFTGEYNLERSRANRSNWVSGVLSHRCNW